MYTVLIVDDEEPVLESYSYLIESGLEDFSVCGRARTGSEAIGIAHEHRPDVVLMDIAMPGIDGLETIEKLQREFPESLYILSTAYERFDLAQRAIPLRVFAYLVKPVSRKRFLETMFRAKDLLDEDREQRELRLHDLQDRSEEIAHETAEFIMQLPWRSFDHSTWAYYRRIFKFSGDGGFVVAIEYSDRTLYPSIAERVELRFRSIWGEFDGRMLLLIAEQANQETVRQTVSDAVSRVLGPGESFAIGVGSRRGHDALLESYNEALDELPDRGSDRGELRVFRDRSREFIDLIRRAESFAEIEAQYHELFNGAFRTWDNTVAIFRLVALIERVIEELDRLIADPAITGDLADPASELPRLRDLSEMDAWIRRLLWRVIEIHQKHRGKNLPDALTRAVRYIDASYTQAIQLSNVADHCNVSVGHLSRLFSEHLQLSFNDYLNGVRLDAAEEMLRTTHRSIKEIAYAVGYQSPNYFSRIFRKRRGISPTEFPSVEHDHAT